MWEIVYLPVPGCEQPWQRFVGGRWEGWRGPCWWGGRWRRPGAACGAAARTGPSPTAGRRHWAVRWPAGWRGCWSSNLQPYLFLANSTCNQPEITFFTCASASGPLINAGHTHTIHFPIRDGHTRTQTRFYFAILWVDTCGWTEDFIHCKGICDS